MKIVRLLCALCFLLCGSAFAQQRPQTVYVNPDGSIVNTTDFEFKLGKLQVCDAAGANCVAVDAALAARQPLDPDLTSWAALTRAAGFDTFIVTPTLANLKALLTNETTVGWNLLTLANPSAISFFQINADNTVTAQTASAQRTALGLAIGSDVQAFDADLTIWAGLTPTANAQSLVTAADYAAMRTLLGLVIGTNVQAFDADLTTWAGLTPTPNAQSLVTAADYAAMRTLLGLVVGTNVQAFDTDLTTWAGLTPTANAQSFVTATDYAAMRTLLGLVIGTNVQAFDADLSSWAAIARASGFDAFAATATLANLKTLLTDETTIGWNFLTLANPGAISFLQLNADNTVTAQSASAQRTALGLAIGSNVQAFDADLETWSGLTPSANAQSFVTAADYAAMRALLGLVIGTNVQAFDADLATWATITPGAGVGSFLSTPTLANLNSAVSDADVATLTGTETLANKTFTAPKFADLGFIADANGNEILVFDTVGSAVNEVKVENSISGSRPVITVSGADANIGLSINPKGTGNVVVNSTTVPASKTLVVTTDKLSVHAATTSSEFAGVISDETGTGAQVFANSPTLITPTLGAATATSINGVALDNNAWSSYTPTVTSSSGTFTSVTVTGSGYKQIGKTVFYRVKATITTDGTSSPTFVRFTLPVTAVDASSVTGGGVERGLTGRGLVVQPELTTQCILRFSSDAGYPGGSGAILLVSGNYEAN